MKEHDSHDTGSASIYAAGFILIMLLISTIMVRDIRDTVDTHYAHTAASLAAVGSAYGFYQGQDAREIARTIAQNHGAQLLSWDMHEGDVYVEVQRNHAYAHARAGPL